MLRMPLGQVTPGMALATAVANPQEPEYDLLKAGFELTQETIDRLNQFNVRTVWIASPNLDFLDAAVASKITGEQQHVYQTLKTSFTSAQKHVITQIDFKEYRHSLTTMITAMVAQWADALMIDPLLADNGDVFLHSSNVSYLSLMLGIKLGRYVVEQRGKLSQAHAAELTNLGLGALLHDLGKMRIPPDLWGHEPAPDKESPSDWQQHTELGFQQIRGRIEPSAAQVAMHHHQRWDGSGFPSMPSTGRPLAGSRIHVFSRIVCLANWYERRLRQVAKRGLPPVAAMKELRGPEFRGVFDPVIFKTFCRVVPPFSIGSIVGLSDGSRAVVVSHNPKDPCRPVVRPLPDDPRKAGTEGPAPDGEDVSLGPRDDLTIATTDDLDVRPFLFPASEGIVQPDPSAAAAVV